MTNFFRNNSCENGQRILDDLTNDRRSPLRRAAAGLLAMFNSNRSRTPLVQEFFELLCDKDQFRRKMLEQAISDLDELTASGCEDRPRLIQRRKEIMAERIGLLGIGRLRKWWQDQPSRARYFEPVSGERAILRTGYAREAAEIFLFVLEFASVLPGYTR